MSRRCAVCGEGGETALVFCRACEMAHHRDCWDWLGSCSRFGCGCPEVKDQATHAVSGPLIIDQILEEPRPLRRDPHAKGARPGLVNYPVSLAASLFMALILPPLLPVWICCVLVSICGRDLAHIFSSVLKR
jgi:hypothetical protein